MVSSQVIRVASQRAASVPVRRRRSGLGFTLIELMIAMGIAAILAAIAYPSYQSQVRKTRRADAQAVLMQGAQYMERVYTENGSYSVTSFPFTKSPIDGTETYYAIAAALTTDISGKVGFRITATPRGAQVGAATMAIDNTGARVNWSP